MFLISKTGKIIYTIKKESDLNKNLNSSSIANEKFSKTYIEAIKTKKTAISNFSYYEPSRRYSAFMISPIIRNSDVIGAVAIQLDIKMFYELIGSQNGLDKNGEILLTQQLDNKVIVISKILDKINVDIVDNQPVQKMLKDKFGSAKYCDDKNVNVISAWGYIKHFNINIIIKVSVDKAYSKIDYLKKFNILFAILVLFIILYIIYHIKNIVTELEETRNRFEFAINGTNDGLWDWDLVTNKIYFSPRFKQMLGYKDDELKNEFSSWEDRVHLDDIDEVKQKIKLSHLDQANGYYSVYRLRHKNGSWIWVLDRGQTIFDKNNKPIRMVGFHSDITKQKELELELLEKEYLLKESQRLSSIGSWKLNLVTNQLIWSDEVYSIFELDKDKFKPDYKTFVSLIHPEDREMVDVAYTNSLKTKEPYEIVHRLLMKDNRIKYIKESCETTFDIDGKPLVSIGNVQDITKQKLLEDKVIKLKQQFEQFMEFMPASIIIKEDDIIIYTNSSVNDFFNLDTLVGKKTEELFPKDIAYKLETFEKEALKNGKSEQLLEIVGINNEKKVYRNMAFVIDNKDKKKLGIVSIDVTNEYRANKEISRVLSAFERSNISVVMTDLKGNIEYVNPSWCRITGYSKDELIGQNPRIVKSGYVSAETYEKMWKELTNGRVWNSELKNLAKDGTEFWEDSTIIPSFNNNDKIDGYIAFKLEINDKIRLREELLAKEELMIAQSRHAAMGEMISMIAHQWRQPISVITMDANNILVDIELDNIETDSLKDDLGDIIKQTKYLSQTIDDFRNFFKPSKKKDIVLISDVFKEALSVISKSLQNHNIEIINKFSTTTKIPIFSSELLQVFINILKNAKEALEDINIKEKKVTNKIYEDNQSIIISICDNAGGINNDIINKVFDPYFTTKNEKNGTGLGLYMSKTIIEKHFNGTLEAYNKDDGVCFEIRLEKIGL